MTFQRPVAHRREARWMTRDLREHLPETSESLDSTDSPRNRPFQRHHHLNDGRHSIAIPRHANFYCVDRERPHLLGRRVRSRMQAATARVVAGLDERLRRASPASPHRARHRSRYRGNSSIFLNRSRSLFTRRSSAPRAAPSFSSTPSGFQSICTMTLERSSVSLWNVTTPAFGAARRPPCDALVRKLLGDLRVELDF